MKFQHREMGFYECVVCLLLFPSSSCACSICYYLEALNHSGSAFFFLHILAWIASLLKKINKLALTIERNI